MSTYTPKIMISQFANAKKAKTDNANGEIQLLIEKDFNSKEKDPEQYTKSHPTQELPG